MIILVRHGQTAANAGGLLLGRADPPLTPLGRAQAEAVRALVPAGARVVTSPLLRARETASILSGTQDPVVDDRWIELDYGEYDQRPLSEVPGEVWDRWRSDPHFTPPGGESLAQCGRRVREACEELVPTAATGDVVVVSHVSPIKAAVAWALGVGEEASWRMFLDVAGVCRITVGARGPSLRTYNETAPPADPAASR